MKHMIRTELDKGGFILFPEPHQSYAGITFLLAIVEAAITTGVATWEKATTTLGVGEGNSLDIQLEQEFPPSRIAI